ncbi:hypothetical protein H0N95_02825 [Candidatus Micrarchaeota archaeon]|nr:hypothetical protein [Candidatus Micrarchaeota archaeon]
MTKIISQRTLHRYGVEGIKGHADKAKAREILQKQLPLEEQLRIKENRLEHKIAVSAGLAAEVDSKERWLRTIDELKKEKTPEAEKLIKVLEKRVEATNKIILSLFEIANGGLSVEQMNKRGRKISKIFNSKRNESKRILKLSKEI